jgi:hypothetical protein
MTADTGVEVGLVGTDVGDGATGGIDIDVGVAVGMGIDVGIGVGLGMGMLDIAHVFCGMPKQYDGAAQVLPETHRHYADLPRHFPNAYESTLLGLDRRCS